MTNPTDTSIDEAKKLAQELEILKQSYDDAARIAKKYLDGQSYTKAALKFTEAIDLANRVPSATKDLLALYNNRSATYEKAEEFDKSLNDITVVLAMDTNHIKARYRRARIYEAQVTLHSYYYLNIPKY